MSDLMEILQAFRRARAAKRAARFEARMLRRIARTEARRFRSEMRSGSPCPKILLGYGHCNKSRGFDCDHSTEALESAVAARNRKNTVVTEQTIRNIA